MDSPVVPWCSLLQLCWLWIKVFAVGCSQLQRLLVSAWGLSSRDAPWCLPHSLGTFDCQAGETVLVSAAGTDSLQGAVPQLLLLLPSLRWASSHDKPPSFLLVPKSLQSRKLWLIRSSFIYFLHAKGHSWPCIFLNPLLQLCRMRTDLSASEMWLLCKCRVGFLGRTGVSPAH